MEGDRKNLAANGKALALTLSESIGNPIEDIDTPRLRCAFKEIRKQADWWPTPKNIVDKMPPRQQRRKLTAPVSADDRKRGAEFFKGIRAKCGDFGAEALKGD
jgi:hypothetical protein